MNQLETLARWGPLGFLAALAAIVFSKLLSGTIPVGGLLTGERSDGSDYFSLGRTQLLICAVVIAVHYIREVTAHSSLTGMANMPTGMLQVLGASQLFYLAGKARALWFRSSDTSSTKGKS
jgi:hypothetical protein